MDGAEFPRRQRHISARFRRPCRGLARYGVAAGAYAAGYYRAVPPGLIDSKHESHLRHALPGQKFHHAPFGPWLETMNEVQKADVSAGIWRLEKEGGINAGLLAGEAFGSEERIVQRVKEQRRHRDLR